MLSLLQKHLPTEINSIDGDSAAEQDSDEVPLVQLSARGHYTPLDNVTPAAVSLQNGQEDLKRHIGKPRRKRHIELLDILAFALSVTSSILAVLAVQNYWIAWRLRLIPQLTVIGFLLSIMNLCLGRAMPYLLVLLEARFGRSTIQNYDGILSNQFLKSRLAFHWRLSILLLLALPLGLSAAYKQFKDGHTSYPINATEQTGLQPLYGLFPVPDIYSVRGNNLGFSIWFNASLPFRLASSPSNPMNILKEPELPSSFPASYGPNTLVLDRDSTALLDMPWHYRLRALQDSLAIGDSLTIAADVHATVAQHNTTIAAVHDPDIGDTWYGSTYGYYTQELYYQGRFIAMSCAFGTADYSKLWLGFVQNPPQADPDRFNNFRPHAQRFDITRRTCRGEWRVTRGDIELVSGSCDAQVPSGPVQNVLRSNTFFIGERWMPILEESLGLFAASRSSSQWLNISMTTMVAGMLWAAVVGLNGEGKDSDPAFLSINGPVPDHLPRHAVVRRITDDELGILYLRNDETVIVTRQTLERSSWLFAILVLQPTLMLLALIASAILYLVPVGKGFGLVSILAGIERDGLDMLNGASFSGELERDVQIIILPEEKSGYPSIRYQLGIQ